MKRSETTPLVRAVQKTSNQEKSTISPNAFNPVKSSLNADSAAKQKDTATQINPWAELAELEELRSGKKAKKSTPKWPDGLVMKRLVNVRFKIAQTLKDTESGYQVIQ